MLLLHNYRLFPSCSLSASKKLIWNDTAWGKDVLVAKWFLDQRKAMKLRKNSGE